MKVLPKTEFGNPILRSVARELTTDEISSEWVQSLIQDMYYTLQSKKYGVGLAAPQVGQGIALSVIETKPTPTRPELELRTLTIINPRIIELYGTPVPLWEACISGTKLYAQVPRYKKLRLAWQDANAVQHEADFEGFIAHVIQHEVDHLNGILFVDKVKDPTTYMTFKEYTKMISKK